MTIYLIQTYSDNSNKWTNEVGDTNILQGRNLFREFCKESKLAVRLVSAIENQDYEPDFIKANYEEKYIVHEVLEYRKERK